MYEEELKRKLLIEELKTLLEKAESIDKNCDLYCEYMKSMILSTYSTN